MKGSLPWKRPLGQGGELRLHLLSLYCLILFNAWSDAQDNPRIVEHPVDHYVAKNEPAKLNCKAQGDPEPKITWYRNGVKASTMTHRLLLNKGQQLFFLRIIHTKNEKPDVGTYYCNATNIYGSAISRSATLKIAVLRDEFRENPKPVTVASGEKATFRCKPPRGEPPPKVFWRKEGLALGDDQRRFDVTSDGNLVISSVRPDDAGKYTCQASNQDGEKESKPALLTVLEKPTFREMPEDIVAKERETVEMKCRASGDPDPVVEWRKEEGRISYGRARQLTDGTLRIENISILDDGLYVCVAENSAGTVEAVGRLTVHTFPSFVIRPNDIAVGLGRTATLQCVVTGNPAPTVFWNTDQDQPLMFSNQANGRFSVSQDGTLRIVDVEYRDEHTYMCQALNALGTAKASARLTVMDDDTRPPPVIVQGPSNQTVEAKETALLACQADGKPRPSIRWYKDGHLIITFRDRIVVLSTGTLKIMDVRNSDSGLYECVAISETGETKWQASLTVSKKGPFHRTQDPTTLPGPPSKLRISDITDTSVHLTWVPSAQMGQSPVFGYIVEYFSREIPGGWKKASESISREGFTVSNLRPDTQYVFLVRAKNSHGVSPPSPISDPIMTREKRPKHGGVNMPKQEIRNELALFNIELKSGTSVNSSAIKVKWEVSTSLTAIEGYIVYYTVLKDLNSNSKGRSRSVKIADAYVFGWNVTGLKPYTWYEVCVSAFSLDMRSLCSNNLKIRTNESVPTAPPQDVVVHKEDDTFKLQWSPPPKQNQNGRITGYVIECLPQDEHHDDDDSKNKKTSNCSTVVDGKSNSITISNILTDDTYNIRIAARTSQGRGTWSKLFVLGPETSDIIQEPWFIWLIAGSIGGALWLALCVFSFWMCRRRRRDKKQKMAQNGMYSAVPVHKSEESGRPGSVVIQRDDVMYSQKDGTVHNYGGLQSDLTSLLDCGAPKDGLDGSQVYSSASTTLPQMKTFYQRPGPSVALSVAPYATTTLINTGGASGGGGGTLGERQGQANNTDSGFRPINHAYVHSSASGSGDSCQKPELRSSESNNTDVSRTNTGHYSYAAGCPHEHCDCMTSPGSDSSIITTDENGLPVRRGHDHKYCKITCPSCVAAGKQQQLQQPQQPVMNWAELLPPPPEHPPPPSEGGSGSGGDQSHSGDSALHLPTHHPHNIHHHHHHPHNNYSNKNNSNSSGGGNSSNNNIAETRFIENRSPISPVSKISACSCPAPHERMFPHIRGNPPAYSDIDYPISHPVFPPSRHGPLPHHSQQHHDLCTTGSGSGSSYHEGSGASSCGGSGSGSQCNYRPQSPASSAGHNNIVMCPPSSSRLPQQGNTSSNINSSTEPMLHRCQSPKSCHNCGGSGGMQQQHPTLSSTSSSSTSSSSQHPHHHHNLHHPHLTTTISQRPYLGDHGVGVGGAYPPTHSSQSTGVGGTPHLYSPAYPNTPASLPGYRISLLGQPEGNRRDSSDLEQASQGHLYPNITDGDESQARRGQLTSDNLPLRASVNSEGPDYAGDSDMEVQRATDCPTPDSSSNGEGSISDTDFASAVARAAELSGLTVDGTTISDPKTANPGSNKKYRKHRTTPTVIPRATSPYSTDSNLSAVVHKPYPKSERKKQLLEQARKYGPQRKDPSTGLHDLEVDTLESDLPAYHRPYYPTLPLHPNYNNHHYHYNYNHFYNDIFGNKNNGGSNADSHPHPHPYQQQQHGNENGTLRSTISGGYAMPSLPPPTNHIASSICSNPDTTPGFSSPTPFFQRPLATFGVSTVQSPPPPPSQLTATSLSHTDITIV